MMIMNFINSGEFPRSKNSTILMVFMYIVFIG